MGEVINLRECLMSDYRDKKYKYKSLIEIYVTDISYYNKLRKKGVLEKSVIRFFDKKGNQLLKEDDISIDAFRKLKYEQIIDEYINEEGLINKDECNDLKICEDEKKLHCIAEFSELSKVGIKWVSSSKGKILFPIYKCKKCSELYTSLDSYNDLKKIKFNGEIYTNINMDGEKIRLKKNNDIVKAMETRRVCYVCENKREKCRYCDNDIENKEIRYKNKKNHTAKYIVKYCMRCNIYYVSFSVFSAHKDDWFVINDKDVSIIEKKREEKQKNKKEKIDIKLREDEIRNKRKVYEERHSKNKNNSKKKNNLIEQKRNNDMEKQIRLELIKQLKIQNKVTNNKQSSMINVKDFVVRRATFRCRNEEHKLENIDGIINVIDKYGEVKQVRVAAGYCPTCNTYFIMESTYQNLKQKGTPICRVSDEKTYLHSNMYANDMNLAQESILRQYGYTVSQEEGLSTTRRRKILALLVDNEFLTRAEIIGYLDIFINQRIGQYKYEKAIEKWENDREFIAEYKAGEYTRCGVSGIYRRY